VQVVAQYPCAVSNAPRVFSSFSPGRHNTQRAGLLIRQAGQAAGGQAEGGAKEKGQGGGAWCAAALAFCLHWRCDLLRRVRPGAYRGRRGLLPVPVPGCWRWH
jgi:hypothetical protein